MGIFMAMEVPQSLDGKGQSEIEMDDDWGYPHDYGNTHLKSIILHCHGDVGVSVLA